MSSILYIRADANVEIGSGHVMRCISIANKIKEKGAECVFIVADKESQKFIHAKGYKAICINSLWKNLNDEIDVMCNLIIENKISYLMIDSYFITKKYLSKLGKRTKIIYIDDLNMFHYDVDILINYNIYAGKINYKETYILPTDLFLGSIYAPLREQFSKKQSATRKNVKKILITSGGSDLYNFSGKFLEFIKGWKYYKDINWSFVSGALNPFGKEIYNEDNITIHCNIQNMAELMLESDIAISAGGTTLYELCACGLPTICFACADNQLKSVREFHNRNIMYYAGDIRTDMKSCFYKILDYISETLWDFESRNFISASMHQIVDGDGAGRIAKVLIERMEQERPMNG